MVGRVEKAMTNEQHVERDQQAKPHTLAIMYGSWKRVRCHVVVVIVRGLRLYAHGPYRWRRMYSHVWCTRVVVHGWELLIVGGIEPSDLRNIRRKQVSSSCCLSSVFRPFLTGTDTSCV